MCLLGQMCHDEWHKVVFLGYRFWASSGEGTIVPPSTTKNHSDSRLKPHCTTFGACVGTISFRQASTAAAAVGTSSVTAM